jgi:sugar (pentulose or hexulose) kinase
MGAAICAALALKIYDSRDEAVNQMVRRRDTFTPIRENVDLYRRINEEVYQHIVPETDDLLKRSHRIFHPNQA